MTASRQLAFVLLLLAGCAPARRPWPRDPRVQLDGQRLRVYGASMVSQKAANRDAVEALRLYLSRLAPAVRVEAVMRTAKPEPAPNREPGAHTALVDLDSREVQRLLGTRYE